jgi:hypothetical protein
MAVELLAELSAPTAVELVAGRSVLKAGLSVPLAAASAPRLVPVWSRVQRSVAKL